jgi:hypothetical protein
MPSHHLVIICCHAIYLGHANNLAYSSDPYNESSWALASFQKSNSASHKPGEHETFIEHITAGYRALTCGRLKQNAVLCFSGAATKRDITPLSEARSYLNALRDILGPEANQLDQLCDTNRIILEENATDSYQNLLFSIIAFRKVTGRYPETVRVITHAFKANRFLDLHAPAILWPTSKILIQGLDPVVPKEELKNILELERKNGYEPFVSDPHGIQESLHAKRRKRSWNVATSDTICEGLEAEVCALVKFGGQLGQEQVSFAEWRKSNGGGSLPWETNLS